MFFEPNNFYYENGHPIKSSPQSKCDANESSYAILYKNRKKNFKICVETLKVPDGQRNPKRKEYC